MSSDSMDDRARAYAIVEEQQAARIAWTRGDDRAALQHVERELALWQSATAEFVEGVLEDFDRCHLLLIGLAETVAHTSGLSELAMSLKVRADTLRARFGAASATLH